MKVTILIVDDEEAIRNLLSRLISLEGFEVLQAGSISTAKKILQQKDIDVILCDVKLPDGNGVDFVAELKIKYPLSEIILLTAYGNIPDGITAMKNGAFDYIVKGDDNDKIIPLLNRAAEKTSLAKRILHLEEKVSKKYSFESIIGKSKSILAAVEMARKVAATDTTVLLLGETGTGKEVFAQAIHYGGSRANKNFVAVNCAAFSRDLLENELFGHKAGAFTGATKDQKGLFEEAHDGTLFLDEIGEMSLDLQAKLLRVLESGEFLRLGETKTIKVNVRIIAATNRDLQQDMENGSFRSDLFYRLSVFQIKLPALRERVVDIELLIQLFLKQFSVKTGKIIQSISPDFLEALKKNEWRGNLRELKNVIERSMIMSNGDALTAENLPYEIRSNHPDSFSAFDLAGAEKLHIQKVLQYTNGNKSETARLLNIALTTLYRKLEEYQIK
jgi:DNA-binding NtrC family response regulator